MFSKHKFVGFFVSLFVLAFSASIYGQTGPVRGTVKLQKADGTSVPVADAVVEPIRIDTESGKAPAAKTNKNGEFSFAGFPVANQYVLAVSGPGIAPTVSNTVRAGNEAVAIIVSAGDGRQVSEAEVREVVKTAKTSPQTAMSEAERKKAQAEYEKQKAKYEEEKKKAEDSNKIINAVLKEGDAAFKAKDYATAIAKFDEGIAADPEFEGSAPVLLNYKGVALKSRGFEAYERASKGDPSAKAAELEKAKADFTASITAFDRGLAILANAKSEVPAEKANYEKMKYNLLTNEIETYRLIVRTKADMSRAKDAVAIYEQYLAAEPDAAKKTAARLVLGDLLREAGEAEPAIVAYRAVLEVSPDNPDALAGLGLSLFNVGVVEENKAKMQEGLNIMQKFADTAPDTHPLKVSVKEAVEYLKTEQKLAPQKLGPAKKKT